MTTKQPRFWKYRVRDVGIEIEGGFKESIKTSKRRDKDFTITRDGSIHTYEQGSYDYEVVTKPFKNLAKLRNTIKHIYKYVVEANHTMGIHIHIAVKDRDYYKLHSYDFVKYFEQKIRDLDSETLIKRFNNSYCKPYDDARQFSRIANRQAYYDYKDSSRYYFINFCYKLHGTIEFRIFNVTKDPERAYSYVRFVVKTVNDFLSKKKLQKFTETLVEPTTVTKVVI